MVQPGQHHLASSHSPLRSAAPPRMILATTTAPECSSRRMVAPCITHKTGRLLRGSPKARPRLCSPHSCLPTPLCHPTGWAGGSASDVVKPTSQLSTAPWTRPTSSRSPCLEGKQHTSCEAQPRAGSITSQIMRSISHPILNLPLTSPELQDCCCCPGESIRPSLSPRTRTRAMEHHGDDI